MLLMFFQTSCVTLSKTERRKIEAAIWLNNSPLPESICLNESQYGFYRRLNSGKFEFVSFCKEEAKRFVAIHEKDLEKLLEITLPSQKKTILKNIKKAEYFSIQNDVIEAFGYEE